jgi:hypothetical protein
MRTNENATLVHGEADNNLNLYLANRTLFSSTKGLGAPARMVTAKKKHGYVTKENILHLLWNKISSRKIFEELKLSYEGH